MTLSDDDDGGSADVEGNMGIIEVGSKPSEARGTFFVAPYEYCLDGGHGIMSSPSSLSLEMNKMT